MIDLYTWTTPNGRKASILLEELGIAYRVNLVNLGEKKQFTAEFLAISPNNKIPALVDHGTGGAPLAVFESGAILTYLAETYDTAGQFLALSGPARYTALEWLHWQIGGFGPMLGQLGFFEKASKEKSELASQRFLAEADRLLKVLDKRLGEQPYLAGESYSIADIATYPWAVAATTFLGDVLADSLASKGNVHAWLKRVGERPAVQRGMAVPQV